MPGELVHDIYTVLLAINNDVFLSHQISTSHQSPASKQYFSLTANQHQSPVTASRTVEIYFL